MTSKIVSEFVLPEFVLSINNYINDNNSTKNDKYVDNKNNNEYENEYEYEYDDNDNDDNDNNDHDDDDDDRGKLLSRKGPASYFGDILNDPSVVWADDDEWLPRDLSTIINNDNIIDNDNNLPNDGINRIKDALDRIKLQGDAVPSFWKKKYEEKASSYWHAFYKRNMDRFYKDRHYLHIVFPELAPSLSSLLSSSISTSYTTRMLEVGCGVGNAVIPLIEINPLLKVYAMDFAKSAIETLLKHKYCQGDDPPIVAFHADIVKDNLENIQEESLDIVLCLFVLSAISPSDHAQVIFKLSKLLKPGGKLLIRDYGRFDEAQLRFKKGGKLDDNFYVRCDGTCSYFFELQQLVKICESTNNLIEEEAKYILRQFANRQKKQKRTRVWVSCKFIKRERF